MNTILVSSLNSVCASTTRLNRHTGVSENTARILRTEKKPDSRSVCSSKVTFIGFKHQPRKVSPTNRFTVNTGAAPSSVGTTDAVVEAYVWGDPSKEEQAACPICHEALLVLEEKGVDFKRNYVDFDQLPDWIYKQTGGQMPVLKESGSEDLVSGITEVVSFIEDKFPEPALGKMQADAFDVDVNGLWESFHDILTGSGGDSAKDSLVSKLKHATDIIKSTRGPFVGADYISATDLALATRLHHIFIALPALAGWSVPDNVAAPLGGYLDEVKQRASWENTKYSEDAVVAYWKRQLEKQGSQPGSSSQPAKQARADAVKNDDVNSSFSASEQL